MAHPRLLVFVGAGVLALVAAACASSPTIGPGTTAPPTASTAAAPPPGTFASMRAELVVDGLAPITRIAAIPGDSRLYVVEKPGVVAVVDGTTLRDEPYLDLRAEVGSDGAEQGLLSLAFHPDFPEDPRVFVTYTDPAGDLHLTALHATPDRVNRRIHQDLLVVPQPHQYHQGGGIAFGPDGYLWLGLGDGGFIGDPAGNGQDLGNLLGTMVRLDVDAATPYAIPPDNPFLDTPGARPEIWAYGLRNPWRFAFSPDGAFLVVADVGQAAYEEIDVLPLDAAGANLGWPVMEGPDCYDDAPCDPTGFVPPTLPLFHRGLCAVIGGPVYHGAAMPERFGDYFFGDFCVGWVRSAPLRSDGGLGPISDWTADLGTLGNLTTLDTDGAGELVAGTLGGALYRLVPVRRP